MLKDQTKLGRHIKLLVILCKRAIMPCCALISKMLMFSLCLIALSACTKHEEMQAQQFFIPSVDGKAHIFGEVNFRGDPSQQRQIIVLIPGTGHTHRGDTVAMPMRHKLQITERFEIGLTNLQPTSFLNLAKQLTLEGHAVVRFDTRGVRCINTPQTSLPLEKDAPCVDKKTADTATLDARLDDVGAVVQFAARHSISNTNNPILIGHSYGISYVSQLIEQKRIESSGLIATGWPIVSSAEISRWQNSDMHLKIAQNCDRNTDNLLTSIELRQCGYEERSGEFLALSERGYTLESLRDSLIPVRLKQYENALEWQKDKLGYLRWSENGFNIVQSHDVMPMIHRIKDVKVPVFIYWGARDILVPIKMQQDFLAHTQSKPKDLTVRVYEGLGHNFSTDEIGGPFDDQVVKQVVADVQTIIQKTNQKTN
jgi:pimeloyl-ACP methyl ester carboxylesterase